MMLLIILLIATVYLQDSGFLTATSAQVAVDRFHKLFYESGIWETTKWLGVPTGQNPNDAWVHQEIIVSIKPDFIVETGTLFGGSAALWATILQQVNPDGRVITIDIKDQASESKKLLIVKDKVDFLIGSSVDPAIFEEMKSVLVARRYW